MITLYDRSHRKAVEEFRLKTFEEGNESLSYSKFDPDNLKGKIWLAYEGDKIVSLSAAEISHYTCENDVLRKCRYHILKNYRHGRYGFQFLKQMIPWAAENNFKLLYWTHDVKNVPLNALYQRKKKYPFSRDVNWFEEWPYTELKFEKDMLFKTGSMLQFIYSIYIDKNFIWRPKSGNYIYYYNHDGELVDWENIKDKAVKAEDVL